MKILKRLLFFILFLLISVTSAWAGGFATDNDLDVWMKNYYKNAQPALCYDALRYYANSHLYDQETTRDMFAVFLSQALNKSPDLLVKMYQDISLEGNSRLKIVFVNVLWLVDSMESRDFLDRSLRDWLEPEVQWTAQKLKSDIPPAPAAIKPRSPQDLDMLWASFFATGDPEPVKNIISALAFQQEKDIDMAMVAGAAEWSLLANAKESDVVKSILKKEAAASEGVIQSALQKILQQL